MNIKRIVDNYINLNMMNKLKYKMINRQNIDKEPKINNKNNSNKKDGFVPLPCEVSFEEYLNYTDFTKIKDTIKERDELDNEINKILKENNINLSPNYKFTITI